MKRLPRWALHCRNLLLVAFSSSCCLNLSIAHGAAQAQSATGGSDKTQASEKLPGGKGQPGQEQPSKDHETIRIGFITSLSGVAAPGGQQMVNGIKMFLDQVHQKIAGKKVELFVENDESNPSTAMVKMKKLIEQDRVDVVDGVFLANIGYKLAPLAETYKLPLILSVTAADDLTKRRHNNWIIRTSFSASQPTQPFGDWVYRKLGYKRIITFGLDYPFSWEVIGGFQKSFEDAGGKVVQKIWAPLGFKDFSEFLKTMRHDADAVFFCTTSGAAEVIPKQYKQYGPGLPVLAIGSSFDDVLDRLGDEAIGALSPYGYSESLQTDVNKKFVRAYHALYNEMPSGSAESAYSSGLFVQKAAEAVKGDVGNREKFLKALKKVELKDDPRGPIKLDDRGNPVQNIYVRRVDKVNGKLQNTVIFTFPKVSQFWTYNQEEYLKQPAFSKEYPPCLYCTPASAQAK
jgi:branched-chain amino acid transport system substrate-binding protein